MKRAGPLAAGVMTLGMACCSGSKALDAGSGGSTDIMPDADADDTGQPPE